MLLKLICEPVVTQIHIYSRRLCFMKKEKILARILKHFWLENADSLGINARFVDIKHHEKMREFE